MTITNILPIFDWEDFLKLCKFIQKNNYFTKEDPTLSDANYRVVISRAYYAGFRKTCMHLKTIGKFEDINLEDYNEFKVNNNRRWQDKQKGIISTFTGGDSHKQIIDKLDELSNEDERYGYISSNLVSMKLNRKTADYCIRLQYTKNTPKIDKDLADTSIENAQIIMDTLKEIESILDTKKNK